MKFFGVGFVAIGKDKGATNIEQKNKEQGIMK
jgi:hypothetical protein